MSVPGAKQASADDRAIRRDEVEYRARGCGPDGATIALLVVNVSTQGLMARCGAALEPGDLVRVRLPMLEEVGVEVRWSLGGRIGCQFLQPVALSDYPALVAAMRTK